MTENHNLTDLLRQVDALSQEDRIKFLSLLTDKVNTSDLKVEQVKGLVPVKLLGEKPKAPVSNIDDYRAARPAVSLADFRKNKNR